MWHSRQLHQLKIVFISSFFLLTGGNVQEAFRAQKHFEPAGPRVNSEFYPGWLDMWGLSHSVVDKESVAKTLNELLAINASVSIYVFHGGTSFGFSSGIPLPFSLVIYSRH